MSSNKEVREERAATLNSLSKSQGVHTAPIYSTPPNSPPRAKPHPFEARRDELHPSGTVLPVLLTPPTSPQNNSKLTPKEKKPAEEKSQMNVLTLKTTLRLDNWKCGCITVKTKLPCRIGILEKNRDKINSQIQSIITLTQSSPELESELDKLVMLIHCIYHNSGSFKDSRIEALTKVFPIGNDNTKPLISVEKLIKKALGQVSVQCIGINTQNERCGRRIGGQKVQNCTKTIDEIIKPEVYLDDAYLEALLKVLEVNMYCYIHVNKRPLKNVALWKSSIMEIRKEADSELVQSIESNSRVEIEGQTRAPKTPETGKTSTRLGGNLTLKNGGLLTPRNSRSLSPDFNRDPVTFWLTAYDTTPFDVITRSDKPADYESSYSLVQREVTMPLDSIEQNDGYVYLYEVEGNKGFVKLGYTGGSVETRHEEWSFDCNRNLKCLYPIRSSSVMVVKNAKRVEALCHAELDHRRIRIYCKACLKQHIEWFEVSPEEAIAVIQKWSKWTATSPYQSMQLRSVVKWSLREEEMRRARDIRSFIRAISEAAKPIIASRPSLDKVDAALLKASVSGARP